MESNNLVDPAKSKLVNVYGDSSELDEKTLENYGVTISGKAVAPLDGSVQNAAAKNKKKVSGNLTSKVFFRFVKTKDTEYSLTVDQLGFKDSEVSRDLKVNAEFTTGVHTWELIFPICISNVEFGVISNSSLKKYSRKFKTTTPRFVTITLDADRQRILYRLNKDPFTDKIVKIDTEGPYSPFVSTTKADVEVILNPYPRVLNHQKLLGKQFNEREHLKHKLTNTFAVSHLPKGFGVNNDSAFITKYFDRNEKEIVSVYLPKDHSPFQALSGWTVIKIDKEENYKQWVAKTITAEGRKVVIHNNQELVDYASDKSIQSRLRGETLQLAQYIYDTYNQDDESVTEHSLFKGLNDFYMKVNTLFNTPYQRNPLSPGLSLHELPDGKLLVVSGDKAKVVEKNQKNAPLNFEHGPKSVNDAVLLTLTKEDTKTLFAYVDWNLLSKKHLEMNRGYIEFFKAAKESATLAGPVGENLEFSVPLNIAKLVIDDLLHTLSKLRLSRSREFMNLSVIGMEDEQHLKHPRETHENATLKNFEVYKAIEKDLSVHDINTVTNIVYRLDEQVWCRSLFGPIKEDISKLFAGVSRPNSALDRLSTFVGQDEPLHKLAEYGYVYRADDALQNVFNDKETRQISIKCHDPINDALVLKNNVNVDLATSLTYLPPAKLGKSQKLLTSKVSDYVFSFTEKGVCKVYTTGINLIEVATIDFKEDAADYITYSNENKKYIVSLINFEINNAKAKANFSATNPLNIKKEKLQPAKGGDVVNKYKPKKGAKATLSKVVKNAQYDEEEDVMDLGKLFNEGEEAFENDPSNEETKEPAVEEEIKENDTDQKKEPPANIKVLGYSALVQKKFKNHEYQASVSCVYESEEKIKLATRALHIDIQPNHLKFCDFAKYGSSKSTNKKKNHEQVASEIINSHRKNIVHYIPFFHSRDSNENYSPLVVADSSELDLTETLTKVIAITETNHSLENTNQLYILGVNKDNKAVLLQVEHTSKENEFKSAVINTIEVADLNVSATYQIVAKGNKVAIVGDDSVSVFNTKDFTERHDIKVDGQLTNEHILKVIDETQVKHIEEPKPETTTENKEEKKQEKTETTQPQKEEEKPKIEEPIQKKDVTADLLKEGD